MDIQVCIPNSIGGVFPHPPHHELYLVTDRSARVLFKEVGEIIYTFYETISFSLFSSLSLSKLYGYYFCHILLEYNFMASQHFAAFPVTGGNELYPLRT